MMRKLLVLALLITVPKPIYAQVIGSTVLSGTAVPSQCSVGSLFVMNNGTGLYVCTATDAWTKLGWSTGSVPQGAIIFVSSGSCPTAFTEVSGLNGRMVRGTVSGNGDVGGTAGADSVTPTFTGNSVASSAVSAGTPAGTNGTVSFTPTGTNTAVTAGTPAGTISALTTGADSSTTGGVAKAIAQTPTFTGSALATHNHTFTGSSGTVPAETFTGSALSTHTHTTTATGTISAVDTRAAYIKLIGCSKD